MKGWTTTTHCLWKTEEDIVVKPFYTVADRKALPIDLPTSSFAVCQTIFVHDEEIANSLAVDALKRGANALQFIANKKFDCVALLKKIDLTTTNNYSSNFIFWMKSLSKELSKFTAVAKTLFPNRYSRKLSRNWKLV